MLLKRAKDSSLSNDVMNDSNIVIMTDPNAIAKEVLVKRDNTSTEELMTDSNTVIKANSNAVTKGVLVKEERDTSVDPGATSEVPKV